jgi:two-component system sensor histidine kinase KdpD
MTSDTKPRTVVQPAPASPGETVIVAVSGSRRSEALVREAAELASRLGSPWEAIHVETPEADRDSERGILAAEALALAARLGATIATLPAARVADGIAWHLEASSAGHLVLGGGHAAKRCSLTGNSLLSTLAARQDGLVLHVHTRGGTMPRPRSKSGANIEPAAPPRNYLYAAGLVLATLAITEVLQNFLGTRPLDLLFLFPVIAVAARLGLGPALLAIALSVICYNFFFLQPIYGFNPRAPQNLVMTGVLLAVAVYTSAITSRMRGRLILSDRSARENASIAALAQKLTRDADWEATALTICEHVQHLLKIHASIYREVGGVLELVAAVPSEPNLGPIDQAALEWAWANGDEAGAGTAVLSTADWQFQPLKTSLGRLAVLALARDDGRDPVGAGQRLLLQTLVAQAALAHERLRLEDAMRDGAVATRPPAE